MVKVICHTLYRNVLRACSCPQSFRAKADERQACPRQSLLLVGAMEAPCDNEYHSRTLLLTPTFKCPLSIFLQWLLSSPVLKVSHRVVHVLLSFRSSSFSLCVLGLQENASPLVLLHTSAWSSAGFLCPTASTDQLKLQTFPTRLPQGS